MNKPNSHLRRVKGVYLLLDILWFLAGLGLLIRPAFSSELICRAVGVLAVIYGGVKLFGYFSKDPYRLAFQFDLALGIFCLVFGLVLIFFSKAVLSLLPVLLGLFTVVSGAFKIQTALDAKRFGMPKWWTVLLLAVCSVALGIVLLLYPFGTALLAIRFMGLAMILYGIQELTSTAYTVNTKPNGIVIDVDDFKEC